MKIVATKENLLEGINTVQKAVSHKNTIPILEGIYLKAKNNFLYFAATDLEIGIECKVQVNVIEEGEIVLPARHFSDLVRKLPNTKITITYLSDILGVSIEYNEAQVHLKGWPGEEFPKIPDLEGNFQLELHTSLLKNMIKQTLFATSADENRPIFTGVLFEINDNQLSMVSTDTHRLVLRIGKINNNTERNLNLIIPGKTLSEVHRIMKDDEDSIKITGNNNQIAFQTQDTRIISRIIEGKFPDYNQVIPTSYKTLIKVKTKDFQETIERANLFSSEKDGTSIIKLSVKDSLLAVLSQSEMGKVEEKLPIYFEGDNIEIAFNAKYLLEVLKVIDSEDINMTLSGPLNPGIIRPGNHNNYTYLLLPLRTV
ncbi:MAG: DNA polymerase III subunit beta [Clostridia bacterium]|nr:DNA polymerase III subunit beta [Clostridia bacterium]